MKIPITIRMLDPEGKKITTTQFVNEMSHAPIGDAFAYYQRKLASEGEENRHQYQLCGEGAW